MNISYQNVDTMDCVKAINPSEKPKLIRSVIQSVIVTKDKLYIGDKSVDRASQSCGLPESDRSKAVSKARCSISCSKLLFLITVFTICTFCFAFAFAQPSAKITTHEYDKAGNTTKIGSYIIDGLPIVDQVLPGSVARGSQGLHTRIIGNNLAGAEVFTDDPDITILVRTINADIIELTLDVSATSVLGQKDIIIRTAFGETLASFTVVDSPFRLSVDPNPIVVNNNERPRTFTLGMSNKFNSDTVVNLSTENIRIAQVETAEVIIPAGQQGTEFTLIGQAINTAISKIQSTTRLIIELRNESIVAGATFDIKVREPYVGEVFGRSKPVGVRYGFNDLIDADGNPIANPIQGVGTGVIIGPLLQDQNSRTELLRGQITTILLNGYNLDAVTLVSLDDLLDITVNTFSANAEGTELAIELDINAAATRNFRDLILQAPSSEVLDQFGQRAEIWVR